MSFLERKYFSVNCWTKLLAMLLINSVLQSIFFFATTTTTNALCTMVERDWKPLLIMSFESIISTKIFKFEALWRSKKCIFTWPHRISYEWWCNTNFKISIIKNSKKMEKYLCHFGNSYEYYVTILTTTTTTNLLQILCSSNSIRIYYGLKMSFFSTVKSCNLPMQPCSGKYGAISTVA